MTMYYFMSFRIKYTGRNLHSSYINRGRKLPPQAGAEVRPCRRAQHTAIF